MTQPENDARARFAQAVRDNRERQSLRDQLREIRVLDLSVARGYPNVDPRLSYSEWQTVIAALDTADPALVEQACPTLWAALSKHVDDWMDEAAKNIWVTATAHIQRLEREATADRDDYAQRLADTAESWRLLSIERDALRAAVDRVKAVRDAALKVERTGRALPGAIVVPVYDLTAALGEV